MLKYYKFVSKSKESTTAPPLQQESEPLVDDELHENLELPKVLNDVGQKWAYLELDPRLRTPILDYHPNERDEVRRTYLLKSPTQPRLKSYPPDTIYVHKRRFNAKWFGEYSWLEYSIDKDVAYCFPCYLFYTGIGNSRTAFVIDGFRLWNQKNKLNEHQGTKPTSHHNNCVHLCEALMNQKQSIESSYTKHTTKEKDDYLVRLKASLEAVKYLVRGGLAFRGHDEGKNSIYKGHFLEFVDVLAKNCEHIATAIKNGGQNHKMVSPLVQKDLVNACAAETIKKVIEEIGDDIFCVLVDESVDCSGKEQMAVVLRFVDDRGCIVERFVGLVHVADTTAKALKEALETLLSGLGLCISKIRGQ